MQRFLGVAECLVTCVLVLLVDFRLYGKLFLARGITTSFIATYLIPTAAVYISEQGLHFQRHWIVSVAGAMHILNYWSAGCALFRISKQRPAGKTPRCKTVDHSSPTVFSPTNDVDYLTGLYSTYAEDPEQLCLLWNGYLSSRQLTHGPSGSLYYKSCGVARGLATYRSLVSFQTLGIKVMPTLRSGDYYIEWI